MKIIFPAVATIILTISGCASTPIKSDGFERIKSKEQYLALVADKPAEMQTTEFSSTAFSDGTIEGGSGDNKLSGTWTWEDGYFCREGTLGARALKPECQLVEIKGDMLKMTRKKGQGGSVLLKLVNPS